MQDTILIDSIDFLAFLKATPDLYLILNPQFKIVGVSAAYLKATMVKHDDIMGHDLFEIFPDNPDDIHATGVRNLRDSLERVLQKKMPDAMAVQKYDIRRPKSEGGDFEVRYWSPINSPVLDNNQEVKYIIHRAEDVTEFVRLQQFGNEQKKVTDKLRAHAMHMEADIMQRAQQIQEANKQLRAANEELARSELAKSNLAAIVESTEDAIITKSMDGIIISWNRGAERLYGYKAKEVIGHSITLLFPADKMDEYQMEIEKVKKGIPVINISTERKHKDGRIIPISVTISPLKNLEGKVIGASSIARDITAWKEVEKLKNEFVSVVSHELRTPLTSIRGALGILASGIYDVLSNKSQNLIKLAINNCDRLSRLINDILDIEKINAGKMKFSFQKLNLTNLIKETVEANKALAESKKIKINFMADEEIFLTGDNDRLIQVMTNLLSNAIRYSPPNEAITVKQTKNCKHVRVSVMDQGPGVPDAFKSKIFQEFSQADSSDIRQKSGTGLGLSICKAIIENHDGKIAFENSPTAGANFYFELPLR